MDRGSQDQIQGEAKDIKGRIERQSGEWTGDRKTQLKGAADQAAGKVQKAAGKLKQKAAAQRDKTAARRRSPNDADAAA